MSKFMTSPRSVSRGSLTRRLARQLLDQRADLGGARRVRAQLEVVLVGRDGGLGVARLLRRLRELEPGVGVLRLQVRGLLIRRDRARVEGLGLRLEVLHDRVRLRRRRLLELVRADRLAELARRQEGLARRRERRRLARRLVLRQEGLGLRELEAAELVPRRRVLRLLDRVLLERRDRARRVVLAL